MWHVVDVEINYILNLVINMAKNKEYFYVGKGKNDTKPWLFYGSTSPRFINDEICTTEDCKLIGQFTDNPIAESIEDNTVIKIYIRKGNEI